MPFTLNSQLPNHEIGEQGVFVNVTISIVRNTSPQQLHLSILVDFGRMCIHSRALKCLLTALWEYIDQSTCFRKHKVLTALT